MKAIAIRAGDTNALWHHGIKGQRWGVRRFQNENGTLTDAGKRRYRDDSEDNTSTPTNSGSVRRSNETLSSGRSDSSNRVYRPQGQSYTSTEAGGHLVSTNLLATSLSRSDSRNLAKALGGEPKQYHVNGRVVETKPGETPAEAWWRQSIGGISVGVNLDRANQAAQKEHTVANQQEIAKYTNQAQQTAMKFYGLTCENFAQAYDEYIAISERSYSTDAQIAAAREKAAEAYGKMNTAYNALETTDNACEEAYKSGDYRVPDTLQWSQHEVTKSLIEEERGGDPSPYNVPRLIQEQENGRKKKARQESKRLAAESAVQRQSRTRNNELR